MMHTSGDWWLFAFQHSESEWTLVECFANSADRKRPHDLLGPAYAQWFVPFLSHVTELAETEQDIDR